VRGQEKVFLTLALHWLNDPGSGGGNQTTKEDFNHKGPYTTGNGSADQRQEGEEGHDLIYMHSRNLRKTREGAIDKRYSPIVNFSRKGRRAQTEGERRG